MIKMFLANNRGNLIILALGICFSTTMINCSNKGFTEMGYYEIDERMELLVQKRKYEEALRVSSNWLEGRHEIDYFANVSRIYGRRIEILNLIGKHDAAKKEESLVIGLTVQNYLKHPEMFEWFFIGSLYGKLNRSSSEIHEIKKIGQLRYPHTVFDLSIAEFEKVCRGERPIPLKDNGDDLGIPGISK